MSKLRTIVDGKPVELTTEHAASSYGIPVLVFDNVAYGPGDIIPAAEMTAEQFLWSCVERVEPIVQGDEIDLLSRRFRYRAGP
jgi:hypothetical protein